MNIKSVTTKYVTENKFYQFLNPEYIDEFAPYYECEIISDKGVHRGKGETEYQAEKAAMENLEGDLAVEARIALEKYYVRNGAGNLEIA